MDIYSKFKEIIKVFKEKGFNAIKFNISLILLIVILPSIYYIILLNTKLNIWLVLNWNEKINKHIK